MELPCDYLWLLDGMRELPSCLQETILMTNENVPQVINEFSGQCNMKSDSADAVCGAMYKSLNVSFYKNVTIMQLTYIPYYYT